MKQFKTIHLRPGK